MRALIPARVIKPLWKPIAGGCHLNRKIEHVLIHDAGFAVTDLRAGYMRGPRPFTFMYERSGKAGVAAGILPPLTIKPVREIGANTDAPGLALSGPQWPSVALMCCPGWFGPADWLDSELSPA